MSNSRSVLLQLVLGPALLLTLTPSGCAVGVAPELDDQPSSNTGGSPATGGNGGGAGKASGGSAGTASPPSTAGTTSVSGSGANPFGGSAGNGGNGGAGSGGTTGGAGSAGSAGSGGAGGSGGTSGGCTCAKTLAWIDDMVLNWATGDCVTSGAGTYLYVGMKAQTYANGDCNPAKQEPWCRDAGNDYKFMACP